MDGKNAMKEIQKLKLKCNQTHYRSYWGQIFKSQMTQPTVSKRWRKTGPKD